MMSYVTGDLYIRKVHKQTLKAWEPFWDCVNILFYFQNSDIADGEVERSEWRLYWVSGVALLRTIGHVLAKVDAKSSLQHSQAIDDFWKSLHSERESAWIFWEFIEKERNNLLKVYSFGAQFVYAENDSFIQFENGDDAFELFREAVYWWRHQLIELEAILPN